MMTYEEIVASVQKLIADSFEIEDDAERNRFMNQKLKEMDEMDRRVTV